MDVLKPKKETLAADVLAWFSPPYIYVDFATVPVILYSFLPGL